MGYLSADEFQQLMGGIRELLLEHGGEWVTSDPGVNYEAFSTVNMASPDAARLYYEARRQATNSSQIFNSGVAHWEKDKLEEVIKTNGFTVTKVSFYSEDMNLALLHGIPETWVNAFKELLASSHLWVMKVDPAYTKRAEIEGAKSAQNLHISYAKENGVLLCKVEGRIDTITAPALLSVLEENATEIQEVKVDAQGLQYISSAGLRVLMMTVKKLGEGTVSLSNTSDAVKDIFETTGFASIIKVL